MKIVSAMGLDIKQFYTTCVSYSRSCRIKGGADEWIASNKWKYANGGNDYLADKIGELETTVYVDPDATNNFEDFSAYSFNKDKREVMKYKSMFLPKMTKNPLGMTLRESSTGLENAIKSDIIYPPYYHEYAEFDRLEFT